MKVSYLKEKLLLTIGYIAVVAVLWAFEVPCLFYRAFDIPCIGCGMTRAVLCALRLDFASAFSYHLMFWSLPVLYLYFLVDGGVFKNKVADTTVLVLIGCGFLLNWVLQIV